MSKPDEDENKTDAQTETQKPADEAAKDSNGEDNGAAADKGGEGEPKDAA